MKIDNALEMFIEKYDKEAMDSIETISQDRMYNLKGTTIRSFNVNESFDEYNKFLQGYKEYTIKSLEDQKRRPPLTPKLAMESANNILSGIIKDVDIRFDKMPSVIHEYIDGINKTISNIEEIKESMLVAGVDQENIGIIDEMTDNFINKINESFDTSMDRFLTISGYKANRTFNSIISNKTPKKPVVFL